MQLKSGKHKIGKIIMTILFLLYLALLIKVILFKYPSFILVEFFQHGQNVPLIERIKHSNFIPLKTIFHYLGGKPSIGVARENLIGNIIAFGPLGFLLPIVFKRIKKAKHVAYTALILSFAFELIQLITSIGDFDIDDIILNVFGAICGYIVYKVFILIFYKRIKPGINS